MTPILVDLPSSWKSYTLNGTALPATGFATYRVKVKLPKKTPPEVVALVTNRIKLAHDVYVNGVRVGGDGVPGETKSTTKNSANFVISRLYPHDASELEILIHVSNFDYPRGGPDETPYLADYDHALNEHHQRQAISCFIAGGFLLIGMYYFALWTRRRSETPSLIFSLFCLAGFFRVLVSTDKVITIFIYPIPSEILLTLDFATVFTAIPLMHAYVHQLFPTIFGKNVGTKSIAELAMVPTGKFNRFLCSNVPIYITGAVWIILILACIFCNLGVTARLVPIFEIYVLFVFLHILYIGVRAIIFNLESSILFTSVFVAVIISGINDILLDRAWFNSVFMFHWGILLFTFAQAVVLSRRFTNVFFELEKLNVSLEKQVHDRTQQLVAEKELSDRRYKETQQLSSSLEAILEKERKAIAMTLHDSLGNLLTGLKMKLTYVQSWLDKQSVMPEEIKSHFANMVVDTIAIHNKLRESVRHIRPELIDVFGLELALKSLVNENNSRNHRMTIYMSAEGDIKLLSDEKCLRIYRICQEAINNASNYAQASQLHILLDTSQDGYLLLNIHDDGIGFDVKATKGTGLIGIREKATDMGGTFELESHIGEGTTITVRIPLSGKTSGDT